MERVSSNVKGPNLCRMTFLRLLAVSVLELRKISGLRDDETVEPEDDTEGMSYSHV